MNRPVLCLPDLVMIVLYFLGPYRLIRLNPYLGLNRSDYWEPWVRSQAAGSIRLSSHFWENLIGG